MLEISRRHSVMLHGSCIPSFEIERATMNCHDQRGPSRASLHGLLRPSSEFDSKENPEDESHESKKKRAQGPIFGSQHHAQPAPQCVGRRIGSSPGDGWAARRDPEGHITVFYGAGL
jgi:hypothetical protein